MVAVGVGRILTDFKELDTVDLETSEKFFEFPCLKAFVILLLGESILYLFKGNVKRHSESVSVS